MMTRSRRLRLLSLLLLSLTNCTSPSENPPSQSALTAGVDPTLAGRAPTAGSIAPAEDTPATRAARSGAYAAALDERGVPTLLLATDEPTGPAPSLTAEAAARLHLARHARSLVPDDPAAVTSLELVHADPEARAGMLLVRLRQRVAGVEVYRGGVRVLMRADRSLVAISGRLHATSPFRPERAPFLLSPESALAGALNHLTEVRVDAADLVEVRGAQGHDRRYQLGSLSSLLAMSQPARVKPIYIADRAGRLGPAWFVELFAGRAADTGSRGFRYVVSAGDGRILERRDLTQRDSFNYRVFADSTGDKRPFDGPVADYTPHPTGAPDGTVPAFIAPSLVQMEGFNHNPAGKVDPWLAATSLQSVGNNVDAYTDRFPPDGFSNNDYRATTSGAKTFDRVYDSLLDPTANEPQGMAAIANLFYVTNWMHDWWYDSGFDEGAGNAQDDNLGRGGVANDRLLAEAQDGFFSGSRNNADMTTPDDGLSPRMQMFVWSGPSHHALTLQPQNLKPPTTGAEFGAASFNVTAQVVLVDDGVGPSSSDGCEAITSDVTGKIALIDRGTCTFKAKVVRAEAAGAAGVIIVDNKTSSSPPALLDDLSQMTAVTIGALGIKLSDGTALKTALGSGVVTATLSGTQDPIRDGAVDNMIVAHEWGHFLHHRLADCGVQQCDGMSEGWGDFNALLMAARDGDNLDGAFTSTPYASAASADVYFGLRRLPYSVDKTRNGLTFKHIGDNAALPSQPINDTGGPNSEVHNTGEVWATMLWEAYVALQKSGKTRNPALTFADVHRRMSDYIVVGLQMAPLDATFTEQRDALLAAAAARSDEDLQVMAAAFARRGAGSCAVSPARASEDQNGVVEDTSVKARLVLGEITLDDGVTSCDGDGRLDGGERGLLTVRVHNGGFAPLLGAKLTISSTAPGVTLSPTPTVPTIASLSTVSVTVNVTLDASVATRGSLPVKVELTAGNSCEASVSRDVAWRTHVDEQANATASDDVESGATRWTVGGTPPGGVWARQETAPSDHAWRGIDYPSQADGWIQSPDLKVNATAAFVISLEHRHDFEVGDDMGQLVNFGGSVIEISDDGGATWSDLADLVTVPYGGTIFDGSGNPLSGRKGFVGKNAAWPLRDPLSLDVGTTLAGKTVRLRFRVGSDEAASAFGWELDNIAFKGIDNLPFSSLVDDAGKCRGDLVASAGPDQAVKPGDVVVLDGSRSGSNKGRPVTLSWKQTIGPTVTLVHAEGAVAAFSAPALATASTLRFTITASDGTAMASDSTDVTVEPGAPPPQMRGCGCSLAPRTGEESDVGGAGGLALAGLALLLARRRRGA